jgi:hypothetical protein
MAVENTLAYYDTTTIMPVEKFIVRTSGIKIFVHFVAKNKVGSFVVIV